MCLFLLLPLLIEPNKRLHKASSNLQSDLFRLFKIGDNVNINEELTLCKFWLIITVHFCRLRFISSFVKPRDLTL